MVLTPEFTISQDSRFIYIRIKCPNVRAQEMEMEIVGTNFHFSADPYLLQLNFQHRILDNENGSANYNIETGYFDAKLEKENEGEDFPEIALFTTLKPIKKQAPIIEVIERSSALEYIDDDPDPMKYGFNFWASNFFENLEEALPYIAEISNPDSTSVSERREKRIEKENDDFDPDSIIYSYIYPQEYDISDFDNLLKDFTPEESQKLLKIPRQEFLMSRKTAKICFLSVADVVFATVYDIIMFGFDGSCESHWTITKISSTLSWFDAFEKDSDLILCSLKRVLLYPIYKSYDFAKLCWEKTSFIFSKGRTPILKCLLHTKEMIEKGEQRWRLNRLYIDPMISWIQELNQEDYNKFANELHNAVEAFPKKNEVCEEWCIDLLEKFAEKTKNEMTVDEKEVKDITFAKEYTNKEKD